MGRITQAVQEFLADILVADDAVIGVGWVAGHGFLGLDGWFTRRRGEGENLLRVIIFVTSRKWLVREVGGYL